MESNVKAVKAKTVNLFEKIINSLVNEKLVYGGILALLMIIIYITFAVKNISNIKQSINIAKAKQLDNTASIDQSDGWFDNLLSKLFSYKNNQIFMLIIYLILLLIFLFLYNREKAYGFFNIFVDDKEKKKRNMGNPLYHFFTKIGVILGSFGIIVIFIALFLWLFNKFSALQKFLNIILFINFVTFILSIVYIIFKDEINKIIGHKDKDLNILEKIAKLGIEFIFLIPCLFIIFVDIVKYEIKITTPTVWILLIIEMIIILLFFLIPFLFNHLNIHDGKQLLKGPVYLDEKIEIGTYQNVEKYKIYKQKIEDYKLWSLEKTKTEYNTFDFSKNQFDTSSPPFNVSVDLIVDNTNKPRFNFKYNYGISFFLYLNPQTINTSVAYVVDTNILDYAGKPQIVFNGLEQKLKFKCMDISNSIQTVYETNDIKYQQWMNIVVNYNSGIVDIFIDGDLRATQSNLEPFMEFSKIYIGSKNGIAGGIKDVTYFSQPLSINKIKYINTIFKNDYN